LRESCQPNLRRFLFIDPSDQASFSGTLDLVDETRLPAKRPKILNRDSEFKQSNWLFGATVGIEELRAMLGDVPVPPSVPALPSEGGHQLGKK
jgi:hypothetical protein